MVARGTMPIPFLTWSANKYGICEQLDAYSQFQSVKVGPGCGPAYGGGIGGKFDDLTAQRNKGGHMKQYRLSEGAW